jgi:hypothetical protein
MRIYEPQKISILEIGIQNGGSLEIWAQYFKFAKKIVGVDINENCSNLKFNDPRIKLIIGDVNVPAIKLQLIDISSSYDIIIDDGSHQVRDVVISFLSLFPVVNESGIYVIEDTHTSYWEEFGGGLGAESSTIGFFKRIIDLINAESWGFEIELKDFLLSNFSYVSNELWLNFFSEISKIESVKFLNSMIIITKGNNSLKKRMIRGKLELITQGYLQFDNTELQVPNQISPTKPNNPWELIEAKQSMIDEMQTIQDQLIHDIARLENEYQEISNEIQTIQNSAHRQIFTKLMKFIRI